MKQEYINKIKEACIKANPEIMELKFGCNIIVAGIANDNPGCEKDVVVDNKIKNECVQTGYFGNVPINDIQEILGRPIQLADVLLAIQNKKLGQPVYKVGGIAKGGSLILDEVHWKLTKPLEDQSEETLKFIAGIV